MALALSGDFGFWTLRLRSGHALDFGFWRGGRDQGSGIRDQGSGIRGQAPGWAIQNPKSKIQNEIIQNLTAVLVVVVVLDTGAGFLARGWGALRAEKEGRGAWHAALAAPAPALLTKSWWLPLRLAPTFYTQRWFLAPDATSAAAWPMPPPAPACAASPPRASPPASPRAWPRRPFHLRPARQHAVGDLRVQPFELAGSR